MSQMHDDLRLYCGDLWTIAGTLLDGNGNAVDLTSASSIDWYLIDYINRTLKLHLTIGSGITVTDAVHGGITITISKAQSAALPPMGYEDRALVSFSTNPTTEWTGLIVAIAAPPTS